MANVYVLPSGANRVGMATLIRRLVGDQNYEHGLWMEVDGMEFRIEFKELQCDSLSFSYIGTIIVEVFAINEPRTLDEIINVTIPNIRSRLSPNIPILLVGTKSDLRQDNNSLQSDLFPMAFGQCLAHLVGAVKYVECSAKSSEGVRDVLEEIVRAAFKWRFFYGITNDDLKRFITSNIPMNNEWMSLINRVLIRLKKDEPALRNQVEFLDKKLFDVASKLEMFPSEDLCFCRALEFDTIHLANSAFVAGHIGINYPNARCTWWCIDELKHQTYDNIQALTRDDLVCRKGPTSLRFVKQDCSEIEDFILSCAPIAVQRLVIISCNGTLSFRFLSALLEGLESLVIVNTSVDFTSIQFPSTIVHSLTHLALEQCGHEIKEVPPEIGRLSNLQVLDVSYNSFTKLPVTVGGLDKLHTLNYDRYRMVFPPRTVLNRSTQDIVHYLKALQEMPVKNREAKLMVLGQEGVGKSTLVKSLKRGRFRIGKTTPPPKTDGVDVSVLQLQRTDCKVYDLAGDVEYLNTHLLFFSPNCLHLVVFNLSQFAVSKDLRSNDQFCRLELWLQTIASQDPHSYAIIVGTHVDHPMLSLEVRLGIRTLLGEILSMYLSQHRDSFHKECLLCNPDKFSLDDGLPVLRDNSLGTNSNSSSIPHILGYYEVSGITNKNIKNLKLKVVSSIADLQTCTATGQIPQRWLLLRETITKMLSEDEELNKQPILLTCRVRDLAYEAAQLTNQHSIVAMLRFFHSQGDFLWYEDIPEMKDIVILDPQWLSDQLRTLISYRSSVGAICEGVLHHSELPEVWVDMAEETRSKLISLFRSVGLCFSISEKEEVFPCKLPVGWPDREMWPPLPNPNDNQTSLLFLFQFVPPSFFPDLIVAVNKKRPCFAPNVQPLYYRFNVVYITQEQCMCPFHQDEYLKKNAAPPAVSGNNNEQSNVSSHRIHLELMPYNNSLKVTIRGPNPCCMIPDIRFIIGDVKSRRYPGITYKERVMCPECELKNVHNPSSFEFDDSHGAFCPKGHDVGRLKEILAGKLSSSVVVPSIVGQTGRIVGETLEDHVCPKLFAVLPINLDSLSLMNRFVYSYLRDGYAVHLLCECPGEWHFVASPGFRVGKPKEFFTKYGSRVCKLLRVISALGAPFKIASAVEPHCKAGVAAANAAESARKKLQSLLENYLDKYPHLKASLGSSNDDLKDLKSSRGLQRSELSRLLEIKATGRDFGPLACTYVDKYNEWLWLCEEHNQKYEIVER